MILNVRGADQAGSITRAMSYAPMGGIRGFSVGQSRQSVRRIKDYHANARDQQFLTVQIECETGVANAAEIAADGVDALFVGPGDLSTNLGAMGNPNADHVRRKPLEGLRRCLRRRASPPGSLRRRKPMPTAIWRAASPWLLSVPIWGCWPVAPITLSHPSKAEAADADSEVFEPASAYDIVIVGGA